MNKRLLSIPLVLLLLAAALIAGCGGDDKKSSSTGSALGDVLSFYPKDSAVVATFASDPDGAQVKAALALVRKIPGGSVLLNQAKGSISGDSEVDVDKDLIPALGEYIALGSSSAQDIDARKVLITMSAKDEDKLKNLLDKDKSKNPVEDKGSYKGADVFAEKDGSTAYAIDGKTLVLGDTEAQIKAALDVRDAKSGITEEAFDAANGSLPKDALVHVYGDAAALANSSAGPGAAQAKAVPWVAALKTYALTVTAASSGLKLGFRLDTTGRSLTDAQLPMTTGARAPGLITGPPVVVGLRGLAQSFKFAEDVAGKVNPTQYGQFRQALSVIKSRTKVDIEKDLIGQFTGDAVFGTDIRSTYVLRSEVKDATALKASLAKLAPLAGNFLQGAGLPGAKVTKSGDLYAVSNGSRSVGAYGVVGDKFVAGNASVGELRSAAGQSATPPPGAKGALAVKVDSGALVRLASGNVPNIGALEQIITNILGDLTGSAQVEKDGLTGELSLAVK